MRKRTGWGIRQVLSLIFVMICGGVLATNASAQVLKGSKALTNEDVLQMAHQGTPESAIMAKIKASPTQFDLSLQKMLALHREGVSGHVLNEMVIAELRRRKGLGGAGESKTAEKLKMNGPAQTLLPAGVQQQTLLGTQSAPSGDGSKSALIPAVQRPAISDGTKGDGSVRTGASGVPSGQRTVITNGAITDGSVKATVPAAQRPAITDGTLAGGIRPASTPQVGTSQTMSTQGNGSSSTMLARPVGTAAIAAQAATTASSPRSASSPRAANLLTTMGRIPSKVNLQVAEECAKDPSMRILSVAANPPLPTTSVEFAPNHQYTIWGCSFGEEGPSNEVLLLFGGAGCMSDTGCGAQMFAWCPDISSWGPNSIVVSVSFDATAVENLMSSWGVPQISGGTLMVFPDGMQGKASATLAGIWLSVIP